MKNNKDEDKARRPLISHRNLPSFLFLYFISSDMMKKRTKQGSKWQKLHPNGVLYEKIILV